MIGQALRQSLIYGGATILSRGTLLIALLVLPLILTPRDYGALSMIVTVGALVAMIVPAEISQGLARHYAPSAPEAKQGYASAAFWFTIAALLAFLVLAQIAARPLCLLILGDANYLPAFRIALLLMALTSLFYFVQNQCRWEFRTGAYVLLSLVYSLSTLALAIGLGLLVSPPLTGVVLGQAVGAALTVALGLWALRHSFALQLDRDKLKEMLRFSMPLIPASLALFLSVYASRLILNGVASLEHVGVYTFASQIAGIATLGAVGVQSALTPLVMAHHQEPETPANIARFFEGFAGVALVACLALGLFAPEFMRLFDNSAYAAAGPLVLVIAPGLVMTQMYVFAPGFAIAKRTGWQMWVSFAGAAVAVGANFVLIQLWGIMGAAVATLLAAATFLTLWFVLSQRLYPVPVRWSPVALASLGTALLGALGLTMPFGSVEIALLVKAALLALAVALVFITGLIPLGASLAAARALVGKRA